MGVVSAGNTPAGHYRRVLPNGLVITSAEAAHADQLEALQRVVFPTLADDERFKAAHYRKHLELFPEGQFVGLDGDRVVAATSTVRLHFDFDHVDHTFGEVIQGGWLTSHEPDGDWLYGADLGVHPDYRGRGLAQALYAARQELVWTLRLKGQVTAGMMSGFGAAKARMSAEEYYAGLVAGRINDPTLSMQQKVGFEFRALLKNYLQDPVCDNYSVLIVLDATRDVPGARRPGPPVKESRMASIQLTTEVPGPRSRALLARRAAAVPTGLGRATDIVVERAEGALVHDVDGNTFLDFVGGIGSLAVGHCPPTVVDAVQAQARSLLHMGSLVGTYESYVRLCELLNEVTPGAFPKKTLLANTGAEAVENAVKAARAYTRRPGVICFEGGYHGRTLLTLSLTSKYGLFKKTMGPFASEIVRLPMPNLYRALPDMSADQCVDWGIQQLEQAFTAQVDPSEVAAMIIEPVQGEGGFVPVPPRFLQRIRQLCDQHGIVMIADEVQCGFARTGKLFALEHYGLAADIIVTAKSLGAGMPVSATTGRADIMDATHPGGMGGTYGGNPVTCVAAIAAIEMMRQPAFLARAERIGYIMREALDGWKARHPIVGDVRGLGSMMLVELVKDRRTKEPAPDDTLAIIKAAFQRGVIAMRAGLYSNGIRFLPPLVITDDQLAEGLDAIESALAETEAAVGLAGRLQPV
ncbi:MAG: aminotransferase class III-fold pyridoxal phosphate-dependent enzyme [Acidobacteria bacterium]|nr:aminotransferase class III-fold pyridoxal phosphate-dependent enzyme [Acidobacteriota bacterium]